MFLEFDVSSYTGALSSATITVRQESGYSALETGKDLAASLSTHAWGAVATTSYNDMTLSNIISDVKTTTGNSAEYVLTLNAAGLTAINAAIAGNGQFKVAIRNYTWDISNGALAEGDKVSTVLRSPEEYSTANYLDGVYA